jgi:hypothetical protein
MHFAPTQTELAALEEISPAERLNYFLTRAMEAEEIWVLGNEYGWVMNESDDTEILPVWPYNVLAQACAQGDWEANNPDSVSLEHFVYNLLPQLSERDIHIEIMPSSTQKGLVFEAKALFEILERKIDAAEYFIEG